MSCSPRKDLEIGIAIHGFRILFSMEYANRRAMDERCHLTILNHTVYSIRNSRNGLSRLRSLLGKTVQIFLLPCVNFVFLIMAEFLQLPWVLPRIIQPKLQRPKQPTIEQLPFFLQGMIKPFHPRKPSEYICRITHNHRHNRVLRASFVARQPGFRLDGTSHAKCQLEVQTCG